jgi:hypothetical protein
MHEVYPSHHRQTQLDSRAFQKKGGWVFSWRDTIQKKPQGMEISLRQNRAFMSFPRFNATGLTNYQTLTRIFVQALPRLATSLVTIGLVFTRIHAIGFGKN